MWWSAQVCLGVPLLAKRMDGQILSVVNVVLESCKQQRWIVDPRQQPHGMTAK